MKKGLNAWTFPNEVPMEKRIEITAKARYDGFECLYEKEGYVGMNSTDAELKLVRKKAEDLGLKIPSIVGAHYEGLSLASGDPKEAAEARERVKRLLHAGSVLGADTALVSRAAAPAPPKTPTVSTTWFTKTRSRTWPRSCRPPRTRA